MGKRVQLEVGAEGHGDLRDRPGGQLPVLNEPPQDGPPRETRGRVCRARAIRA